MADKGIDKFGSEVEIGDEVFYIEPNSRGIRTIYKGKVAAISPSNQVGLEDYSCIQWLKKGRWVKCG